MPSDLGSDKPRLRREVEVEVVGPEMLPDTAALNCIDRRGGSHPTRLILQHVENRTDIDIYKRIAVPDSVCDGLPTATATATARRFGCHDLDPPNPNSNKYILTYLLTSPSDTKLNFYEHFLV